MKTYKYYGRADGIGNRIEQLMQFQEFCDKENAKCIYIWNNSHNREYLPLIEFPNIEIIEQISLDILKLETCLSLRSIDYQIPYRFLFDPPPIPIPYDVIIHVRGTDRIQDKPTHPDFSTQDTLDSYIEQTIHYLNTHDSIQTYTIVSDESKYIDLMRERISKTFVSLSYPDNIQPEWIDFYYLTQATQYVFMCSQFSSFSATAAVLSNTPLLIYPSCLDGTLPRYKANTKIIQTTNIDQDPSQTKMDRNLDTPSL